jgi:endonuclease III
MCEAGVGEWSKLPGIGKKTAKVVVKALQGK